MRCEDYPCCGHNETDNRCDGHEVYTQSEYNEAFWCDFCGIAHRGPCPDEEICDHCGEETVDHADDCPQHPQNVRPHQGWPTNGDIHNLVDEP